MQGIYKRWNGICTDRPELFRCLWPVVAPWRCKNTGSRTKNGHIPRTCNRPPAAGERLQQRDRHRRICFRSQWNPVLLRNGLLSGKAWRSPQYGIGYFLSERESKERGGLLGDTDVFRQWKILRIRRPMPGGRHYGPHHSGYQADRIQEPAHRAA